MASSKMAWSKSTRIKVMIAIDTTFFLLELITGFLAHSLALTADAFHMLNDIISLVIGLWAVVAAQKTTTDEFTFGWVRAEILGAFFNAVFLIALCVSIILEAVTRLVEPPEISNPLLMLGVGFAGLFSNLVGFLVLGGHGHSHGSEEHDHDHDHDHGHEHVHNHSNQADLESGRGRGVSDFADGNGRVGDVLPESTVSQAAAGPKNVDPQTPETARRIRFGEATPNREQSHSKGSQNATPSRGRARRTSSKSGSSHARFASIDDMSIHPTERRQDMIAAYGSTSQDQEDITSESDLEEAATAVPSQQDGEAEATESSPLLGTTKPGNGTMDSHAHSHSHDSKGPRRRRDSSVHQGHNHTMPKPKANSGGHGHNHADMGMNAMILHVIGDALGNVGVIITALVIWYDLPGKLYADPAVSLFITAIILNTSIPLTRATSKVLLQATPAHISISEIRQDIEQLPGVVSCHCIHVWQLSDTKVVASLHLQVSASINTHSGEKYMQLAKRARKCLHGFGIHSATIQPEFCLDQGHNHNADGAGDEPEGIEGPRDACLLECVDDCSEEGCCAAVESLSGGSSGRRPSESTHSDRSLVRH